MSKKRPAQPPVSAPSPAVVPPAETSVTAALWWQNPWLLSAVIVVLSVLAFLPVLRNGFMTFDDGETIYYNKIIQNPTLGGLLSSRIVGMYVPVSALIYTATYHLIGSGPAGFHAVSLLLHAGVSVLGFVLLRKLNFPTAVAFLAALLSAVHPVKAEPIAWVAAQTTLTFTLFYLAALICWVNYRQQDNARKWLIASLVCFTLSTLSKSAAVTLPLLLPVLDWYLGVYKNPWRVRQYGYLLLFLSVSFVLGVYTFFTRTESGAPITIVNANYNLFDRLLMVTHTLLFYLAKLLAPVGLTVNYPFTKTAGVWRVDYYLAPLAVAGAAYWLFKTARKERTWLFAALLFVLPLGTMLPVFSVGSFELRSDRYLYFSALGAFLALIYALYRFRPAVAWGAGLVGVLVYAAVSFQQTRYWHDDKVCFEHCVDLYPESVTCNCNLAYGALLQEDYETSIRSYTQALKLDPKCYECRNGRGQAYLNTRKIPEALEDFDQAIKAGIVTPKLFLNHAKCLVMLNRSAEALPDLNRSLELEQKNPETWYFRAVANEKTGNLPAAVEDYGKAIQLNPNYVEALVNRGLIQFNSEKYPEAVADYSAALKVAAAQVKPMILNNRANAYIKTGQNDLALADVNEAIKIQPNYIKAYGTRSNLLLGMGRMAEGLADLAKVQQMTSGK